MALDERYILMQDPESYFVDKDSGLPLANGLLYSFRDDARNEPKTLYQLTGNPGSYTFVALPNPVPLSDVGTPQNAGGDNVAIYYFPYRDNPATGQEEIDLYYLQVKSEDDVEQFTRPAWPNISGGNDPTQTSAFVNNEISNAQFSKILINEGATTFTVSAATSQVFELAPDWSLIISGTGTVIVEQVALDGNTDITTNPAFALEITVSSGVTDCRLNQRFNNNSGLWSNTYLAGSFVAKCVGGTGFGLSMYYAESLPTTSTLIASAALTTEFVRYAPAPVLTPTSTNTQDSDTGYIDIYLALSASTKIQVTSVQVAPSQQGNVLPYDNRSSNRELAMMGDYFIPRLYEKQVPSLLTGWDFPLNPRQFGPTPTITGTAAYIYDQTIAVRVAGNMTTAASSVTGGLQVTTGTATDAFYLLQYLTDGEAKKILGTRLSVNVNAYKGTVGTDVTCRVYLFRGNAASAIPTLGATIGSLDSGGIFTKNNTAGQGLNWTEIPRSNLGTAQGNLSVVTTSDDINDDIDLRFIGWEEVTAANISDTDKFAMVVTFQVPTDLTVITVNSISLVPGDIPTRPAPQTVDEVLRECRFYYQKSFLPATVAAAGIGVGTGESYGIQVVGVGAANAGPFIRFTTTMRATPTVVLLNPAAANNEIRNETVNLDYTASASAGVTTVGFRCAGTSPGGGGGAGNLIGVHWTADARLGI